VQASPFEFRHRFWVIAAIFAIGFLLYNVDRQNAAARLVHWALPASAEADRRALRAVFYAAAGAVVLGALLRTWASAFLRTEVVHDQRLHADRLTADGPYRFVRNPLYLGLLLLSVGIAPLASGLGALWIVAAMTVFQLRLVFREEQALTASLGESYRRYAAAVPRLMPALTPQLPSSGAAPRWRSALLGEAFVWMFAVASLIFAHTVNLRLYGAVCLGALVVYLVLRRRLVPAT